MIGVEVGRCDPEAGSTKVYQWGTFVHREHRGHKLGLATKAVNLAPSRVLALARSQEERDPGRDDLLVAAAGVAASGKICSGLGPTGQEAGKLRQPLLPWLEPLDRWCRWWNRWGRLENWRPRNVANLKNKRRR